MANIDAVLIVIGFFTETRQTNEGMANKLANTYQDHKWLHTCAANSGDAGRGIAVFHDCNLQPNIHEWKAAPQLKHLQILSLMVDGHVFNAQGRVLLAGCYIPPVTTNRTMKDITNSLTDLHTWLEEAYTAAERVMVVGDFNMRIHSPPEPFDSDNPCLRAFPLLANPRLTQEKDDKLDSKSKAFLDLMAAFNLILTTGRGRGDTCYS
jgi:exonuclease III